MYCTYGYIKVLRLGKSSIAERVKGPKKDEKSPKGLGAHLTAYLFSWLLLFLFIYSSRAFIS